MVGWGSFPLLVVALAVAAVVASGRERAVVVAESLPTPRVSTGQRVVDLVRPSVASRVLDVHIERPAADSSIPARARWRVQLWTGGRSALVVVREGAASGGRFDALAAVASGRARLQLVADRDWIDLDVPGRVTVAGADVRIISLTHGALALAALSPDAVAKESGRWAVATDPLGVADPESGGVGAPVRARLVVDAPLSLREVVQRLAFFPGTSVLGVSTALIGLLLCCFACARVGSQVAVRVVCAAVAGPALVYVALIPPLQNADETSHTGTLETVVWRSADLADRSFPMTISDLALALDQDRVQHNPDEVLPVSTRQDRERIRSLLTNPPPEVPVGVGTWPPGASVQSAGRAPAFVLPFRAVAPVLRGLPLGDRLTAYRLGSLVLALSLIVAGARLLDRAGANPGSRLVFTLVLLLPAAQAVLASPTNYGLALGVGALGAALACDGLLWRPERELRSLLLLTCLWVAATSTWRDASMVGLVAAGGSLGAWAGPWRGDRRRGGTTLLVVVTACFLALLCASAIAWAVRVGTLDTGWLDRPRRLTPSEVATTVAWIALPAALAFLVSSAATRIAPHDAVRRRTLGRRLGAVAGISTLVAALLLPHATVPYERTFLPFSPLVWAYLRAFLANALSWDQDVLSWKLWVGALGWHDAFYSDAVYFSARCLTALSVIFLPSLALDAAASQPRRFSRAVRISGIAASLAISVLAVRHAFEFHPTIRYLLPILPTLVLPLGALAGPRAERWLRLGVRLGIGGALWGAVAVAGQRWLI